MIEEMDNQGVQTTNIPQILPLFPMLETIPNVQTHPPSSHQQHHRGAPQINQRAQANVSPPPRILLKRRYESLDSHFDLNLAVGESYQRLHGDSSMSELMTTDQIAQSRSRLPRCNPTSTGGPKQNYVSTPKTTDTERLAELFQNVTARTKEKHVSLPKFRLQRRHCARHQDFLEVRYFMLH